jgi:hypothetical protein
METLIKAIQSTPIPTMLIVAGLFILVLAFVTKIGGIIEVSPEQKRWTIPTGLLLLTIGLILNFATIPQPATQPTTQPTTPPITPPITPPLRTPQELEQALVVVNIDFSDPKLRAQLDNSSSKYPQFAEGCLKLLSNKRLKKKVYFDVIFWNYTEELRGNVNLDSPDGDLNTNTLKAAMVSAYNTRNGSNALSFGDIVE